MAARCLAQEQRWQRRLVAERLVEGRGDTVEQRRLRLDLELLVPCPVPVRDGARVLPLVVAAVGKPDRERPHRLGRGAGHRRDDDRGVEPAGEEGAERHVGDEPAPDGRRHLAAHAFDPVSLGRRPGRGPRAPVALDPDRAGLGDDE